MPEKTIFCLKCGSALAWWTSGPLPNICPNPDCQTEGQWTTISPFLLPSKPHMWELNEKDVRLLKSLRIALD